MIEILQNQRVSNPECHCSVLTPPPPPQLLSPELRRDPRPPPQPSSAAQSDKYQGLKAVMEICCQTLPIDVYLRNWN